MSVNENFAPQSDTNNPTQLSADPNVRVPDHVQAAAAAADALHKQLYTKPEPETVQPVAPAQDPAAEEAARAAALEAAQGQPAPAAQEQHPAPTAAEANISAEEWRHRFLSMQGRFNAATRDKGAMEEQMRQLGQELVRTQNLLAAAQQAAPDHGQRGQDHGNLITAEDRENYGDELIDLARRAARDTVAPELDELRNENQRLQQRVARTAKQELFATLDGSISNWRDINKSQQFKLWLRLPNIYTGQLRGNMLKAAVDGAEAPKVIALFRDFLAEANATGQQVSAAPIEQQLAPQAAPRVPALDLETLAAPGRARPASGDSQVPSEKPIYSRAQISQFYNDKRRGLYAGRDAEVNAFERDLEAAQREGRIR